MTKAKTAIEKEVIRKLKEETRNQSIVIGKRFRAVRERMGLTIETAAKHAKLEPRQVQRIENGSPLVTIVDVLLLSQVLHASTTNELFGPPYHLDAPLKMVKGKRSDSATAIAPVGPDKKKRRQKDPPEGK